MNNKILSAIGASALAFTMLGNPSTSQAQTGPSNRLTLEECRKIEGELNAPRNFSNNAYCQKLLNDAIAAAQAQDPNGPVVLGPGAAEEIERRKQEAAAKGITPPPGGTYQNSQNTTNSTHQAQNTDNNRSRTIVGEELPPVTKTDFDILSFYDQDKLVGEVKIPEGRDKAEFLESELSRISDLGNTLFVTSYDVKTKGSGTIISPSQNDLKGIISSLMTDDNTVQNVRVYGHFSSPQNVQEVDDFNNSILTEMLTRTTPLETFKDVKEASRTPQTQNVQLVSVNNGQTYLAPLGKSNSEPDKFAHEYVNGNATGYTVVQYDDGRLEKILSEDFSRDVLASFDTTTITGGDKTNYGGVSMLDGKESGVSLAQYMGEYAQILQAKQGLTEDQIKNIAFFSDSLALTSYMVENIKMRRGEDGKIAYDESEYAAFIDQYKKLGIPADFFDKAVDFTSPLGLIAYIARGWTFDRSNNTTGRVSLNLNPNNFRITQAIKDSEPLSKVLGETFKQNHLVYAANIGGGN